MRESVVKLRELKKDYFIGREPVKVLKGINMDVFRGEFVGIMGASGSGKSTMLNILGLLDRPTAGTYHLDGVESSTLNDDQLAALRNDKIGFIFQSFNLFSHLTVEQNIEVPLVYGGVRSKERRKMALDMAAKVGLAHRVGHRPSELSGGERQRIAIARALVNQPAFLLADEPTGNLDEKTGYEIMQMFDELHHKGTTIVMVTHNPEYTDMYDRVIYLRDGQVTDQSPFAMHQGVES